MQTSKIVATKRVVSVMVVAALWLAGAAGWGSDERTHQNGGGRQIREYYVSPDGKPGNPGTREAPLATIQAAADVAQAGDTVFIKPGTYCETVKPKNSGKEGSPITFRNCPGEEKPTICAGDRVTGPWTLEGNNIYWAPCNWGMGPGRNQVVADGDLMIEAREPNIAGKEDLMTVRRQKKTKLFGCTVPPKQWPFFPGTNNEVVVSSTNRWEADFWKGGMIWACGGWASQSAVIANSQAVANGHRLVVRNRTVQWWFPGNLDCFLTGVKGALDVEKEFFLDEAAGRLYLRAAGSVNPSSLAVYAKKRVAVIDMSGLTNVVFDGVNTMMGGITMGRAVRCELRNGRHLYSSHFYTIVDGRGDRPLGPAEPDEATAGATARLRPVSPTWKGGDDPAASAVYVSGQSNRIEGCEIAYAATGVRLDGRDHVVRNCTITDCYGGTYFTGVFIACYDPVAGEVGGHLIERNTIGRVGRGAVHWTSSTVTYPNRTTFKKCRVLHNHLFDFMMLTYDGGAIYSWFADGGGTEIAYNWIHGDGGVDFAAIYCDDKVANFIAHHNVIWDVKCGFLCKEGPYTVHNNTVWASRGLFLDWGFKGAVHNNLGSRGRISGTETNNNLITRTQKLFVGDPTQPSSGLDFRLQAGSPAINAGVAVSNFTEGAVGAPDVGAYEYGGADNVSAWTAGAWSEPTRPAQPDAFTARADFHRIDLAWTDRAATRPGTTEGSRNRRPTAYVLERSADGSTWTSLATLPTDAASYIDAGFHLKTGTRYQYRLAARNSAGLSAWATVAATTSPVVRAPAISSPLTATGGVGFAFSYTIVAANGPESFAAAGLPKGLVLNAANGVLSGRPEAAGTANVSITATNAKGSDTRTLALTIEPNESFVAATGGTIVNYTEKGVRYRAHIFNADGTFRVADNWSGEMEYLIVAGGGAGGGGHNGAGGGAGGVRLGRLNLPPGTYSVTVGAGGTGNKGQGSCGGDSSIAGGSVKLTATGGGYGGGDQWQGSSGGSGGGAGLYKEAPYCVGAAGLIGNMGGDTLRPPANEYVMGGGGGAGGLGGNASGATPGAGGSGTNLGFSGASVAYARGGDGNYRQATAINGASGATNTGNGGGGAGGSGTAIGGSGGSGIVIVRYVTGGKEKP